MDDDGISSPSSTDGPAVDAMPVGPRDVAARTRDSLRRLERDVDAWVASAGQCGEPPAMVPLSIHWDGADILVVTRPTSRTGRNMRERGKVRLALGTPRDVVLVDATAIECGLGDIPDSRWAEYVDRAGWDPRGSTDHRAYLLTPVSVQAWREADEQVGRAIMRDGAWLAGPTTVTAETCQTRRVLDTTLDMSLTPRHPREDLP